MIGQDDIARLASWDMDEDSPIPWGHYDRMESHPRYADAVSNFAARMLDAAWEDRALDGIVKDVGRYFAAAWAIYLHVSGGLTLRRLKEIGARSGLLSFGRARTLLLLMRYLGYVEPAAGGGRRALYLPTPALLRTWKRLVHESLDAVRLVEPAVGAFLEDLDDYRVLERFLQYQGSGFLKGAQALPHETAFFRVILHRNAGSQMLYWLIAAGEGFPPRSPIPVSAAKLSRQLRVSRMHVQRLIADAVREGLLTRPSENSVQFTDLLARDARYILSTILLGNLICAAKTAKGAIDSGLPG